MLTPGSPNSQKSKTLWHRTDIKSHWPVQVDGLQILLELRQGQPQGCGHDTRRRVLLDTAKSFVYNEGGLKGILMASRLSGLSPNLTARFTPGTLISSYEVFEALRRGIAVPFRKRDAESIRNITELKASDKGA